MFSIFLFALSIFTSADKIVIESNDLLKPPAKVQGDFKIASNPPRVEVLLFKGLPQEDNETLWTSWGNGIFASNGKYYTAIGDHRGYDGNSYVYEYDPMTSSLKKIVDIAEAIGHRKGEYGHGKIHAQIHEYHGSLYFASHWGKIRLIPEAVKKGYKGSILFRYDLKTQKLENLGTIAPTEGLPGSCLDPNRGLLYFYAAVKGDVVAYDLNKRSVKFKGGAGLTGGQRWFILSKEGKLFFSNDEGKLSFYDPDKNSITSTAVILPGTNNKLRSATRAASDGRIWGMTESGRLFEFNSSKLAVKDLGPNFLTGDYTAVMVLSPDDKYIYFAPGAHGSATRAGTPVIQYEIATGKRKVIAFLLDPLLKKASYCIGGDYSMQLDPKGTTLYSTFNGAPCTADQKNRKPHGLPALVVIKIPEKER